ncbi:MAG: TonB-dependent receptor [Burkholderiales bacterium]|nr:TonB-dependent receptor [Burkholderiales bacterium]
MSRPLPRTLSAPFSTLLLTATMSAGWAAENDTDSLPTVSVTGTNARAGSLQGKGLVASKTDTPLRDIPASVVVVPLAVLHDQGVTEMNQALANVSGVQPVMAGGYGFANNYAIRGQAMRFLRDGYVDGTSQNGYWRTFADVERIEVLKGPGSALFGAGQAGGTMNVATKQPERQFGAEVSAGLGSFGSQRASADMTGPLSDKVAARLIVNTEKSDGWRDLSRDIQEVLPSLTWWINDQHTLKIDYDHRELKVKPDNYGLIFDVNAHIVPLDPANTSYYSPMNFSDQTIDRLTLAHDWTIAPDLTMRTALIQDHRDLSMLRNAGGNVGNASKQMTGRNVRTQTDDVRYTQLQNEVVWKWGPASMRHTILGGVELSDTSMQSQRVGYNLPNIADIYRPVVPETSLAGLTPVTSQGFDRRITSTGWGLYVQDQVALGEQFKLRAGLRTEQVRVKDDGLQGGTTRTVADTLHWTTGSLGAVWQPSSTTSLYAGWSNGKFVNLSTEPSKIASSLDGSVTPEASDQIELGAKLSWLAGKLDLTSALFETRRSHYYITLPDSGGNPTPDGADRTQGLEFDLNGRPLPGLTTQANFVWQDAKSTANLAAISGKRPSGVAQTGSRIAATYRLPSNHWHGWGVGAGATYKGASYADSANLYRVPSYVVVDGSVFYETPSWEVRLDLRNLADRRYFVSPTFSGALPGEGRSAYLTATYRVN